MLYPIVSNKGGLYLIKMGYSMPKRLYNTVFSQRFTPVKFIKEGVDYVAIFAKQTLLTKLYSYARQDI